MQWNSVHVYFEQACGGAGLVAVGWIVTHPRVALRALEKWDDASKQRHGIFLSKSRREWRRIFAPVEVFVLTFFLLLVSAVLITGNGDAAYKEMFAGDPKPKTAPVFVKDDNGLWREPR